MPWPYLFLFIGLFLLVFIGGHVFLYYSFLHFFRITAANARIVLAACILFLAAGFFLASFLSHWKDTAFGRGFYFAAGLWLGVAVGLLTAFVAVWFIHWLGKIFGLNINLALLGALAVAGALIASAYGVWNAYNLKAREIDIKISNLPAAWEGKKAVQISDVHLGHVFGKSYLQKIVDLANAANPDVVFITGDLFDGMDGNLSSLVEPLKDLHAPWGTYFITGNHETYLGRENVLNVLKQMPVIILSDKMTDVQGVQIIGLDYPDRSGDKNVGAAIKGLPGFDPAKPSILLWHSPTQVKAVEAAGISLQLSGHTHNGQIFPINFITRLIYGKYSSGLNQEGNFSVYTSVGAGAWGPTIRNTGSPEIAVIKFGK